MDEKELMTVIGNNIRRFRKSFGMTQEQLAEAVNRTPGSISHMENGTSILGVELLVKMADLFSVSVDDLVRRENTTSRFQAISSLLSKYPDDALASLEPFIRLWVSQHNGSTSLTERS